MRKFNIEVEFTAKKTVPVVAYSREEAEKKAVEKFIASGTKIDNAVFSGKAYALAEDGITPVKVKDEPAVERPYPVVNGHYITLSSIEFDGLLDDLSVDEDIDYDSSDDFFYCNLEDKEDYGDDRRSEAYKWFAKQLKVKEVIDIIQDTSEPREGTFYIFKVEV